MTLSCPKRVKGIIVVGLSSTGLGVIVPEVPDLGGGSKNLGGVVSGLHTNFNSANHSRKGHLERASPDPGVSKLGEEFGK